MPPEGTNAPFYGWRTEMVGTTNGGVDPTGGRREPAGRRTHGAAVLGLGLAAVGRPAYITSGRDGDLPGVRSIIALRARAHALLDAAADLNICFVDAARSYGLAEDFLGSWLRQRQEAPFVASKWGYTYTAGWRVDAAQHEVKDHSSQSFERQLAETSDLLAPWLRLYQVHSLTLESPLWTDQELLERLAGLRAEGVDIGFSTSGPGQAQAVRRGLEVTVDGTALFASVQTTWNLLEPSAGEALAEAHAAGVRVIVKEALANGRLIDRRGAAGSRLDWLSRRHDVGIDAVALAAALAQPWCDVVLCGAVTVPQLRSNAGAPALAATIGATELLPPESPEQYWFTRSQLAWG